MPRPDTRLDFAEALELLAAACAPYAAIARDPRRGFCSARKRLTRRLILPALHVLESPPDADDDDGARRDAAYLKRSRTVREPKRPGKYTLFGWRTREAGAPPCVRLRFRVRRG